MSINKKTCVIIPAFNEAKNIAQVIDNLKKNNFENIIVINDNSSDETESIALKKNVTVLNHKINLGMGAATQTGIEFALKKKFQFFLTIDADGQQSVVDLKKILISLQKYNCVIGSRFLQKNKIPFFRRIANKIANILTGCFFGVWVTDSQSGLRGFTRKVAKKLNLYGGGFEFCSDFIREVNALNFKIHEVPISVVYTKTLLKKGQHFAEGLKTFGKLFLKAITRLD